MGQAVEAASSPQPAPSPSEAGGPGTRPNAFIRLVDPAIPAEMAADPDILRRARVVLGFTLSLIVLGIEALVFFAWALPGNLWQHLAVVLGVGLGLTAAIPLAFRRFHSLALGANLVIAGSWIVIVAALAVSGGIEAPLLHWCALMPMLAVLMGARRSAVVWTGIGIATVGAFMVLDSMGASLGDALGMTHLSGKTLWVQRGIDVASWLGVLLAVALLYEAQRREQNRRLALQNSNLETEIQQRTRAEERNRYLAYYDELTALPNRRLFEERMTSAISQSQRLERTVAVLFLDLDGFKTVNDTLGHGTGDRLLEQVAERLRSCVRLSDTVSREEEGGSREGTEDVVSRRGGDEFTVLLSAIRNHREAAIVADRVLHALADPFFVTDHEISISVSIGIAMHTGAIDPFGGSDLLRKADLAMYHAKDCGRNNFQFFEEWMTTDTVERATLASELRHALEHDEFELYYQPIARPETHEVVGVEALARWHHPQRGLTPAAEFIEVAEENGLTIPIGEWALRTAVRDYSSWQSQGLAPPRIAVNVSGAQFRGGGILATVANILREHEVAASVLELEVTEGAMLGDVDEVSRCLSGLKDMGVSIALDDFGTGYSSLSFVKRFPVDRLKIDRSFVSEIETDPEAQAIVTAILAMAHQLGLAVVAEGVETEAQERVLREHRCEELQGYLFGRPMPAAALAERMRTGKNVQSDCVPSLPVRKVG